MLNQLGGGALWILDEGEKVQQCAVSLLGWIWTRNRSKEMYSL
jgi:hypothetical protein